MDRDGRRGLERARRPRSRRGARRARAPPAGRASAALRRRAGGRARGCRAGEDDVMSDLRIGVAGLGYWGPNLARNFAAVPGCELAWICDADPAACERVGARFPGVRTTMELDDLLDDPAL